MCVPSFYNHVIEDGQILREPTCQVARELANRTTYDAAASCSLANGQVVIHATRDVVTNLGLVVVSQHLRGALDAVDADTFGIERLKLEHLVTLEGALERVLGIGGGRNGAAVVLGLDTAQVGARGCRVELPVVVRGFVAH